MSQNSQLLTDASKQNIQSALDISVQLPNNELKLKAWIEPERSQFMQGDKLRFKTSLSDSAYLAVYVHSMDGSTYLIYPNHLAPPQKLSADSVFTVGNGAEFELEIAEPFGVDIVQLIATTDEKEFKLLLSKHTPLQGMNIATAKRAAIITEMQGIKKRGIKVVNASTSAKVSKGKLWGETLLLLNTSEKK